MKEFLMALFLISSVFVSGQNVLVSGQVKDEFGPLPGASVIIKNSTRGTLTDEDGRFEIEATSGDVLEVSFLGMTTQELEVGEQTEFLVTLTAGSNELEEIVVVGYGAQKLKDLTSAITTVRSEDLEKTPAGQAMQGLQGKVAGVQVVSSGVPGQSPTVRVRGVGSFPENINDNDESTASPLYVVDGMFFDNIDFLNPSDISSMSVLKDASAAAIYGVRAANGVILIETKTGSYEQKPEIVYDGYYGIQQAQNILQMANAEQFVTMAQESGSEADIAFIQNAMQRYGRSRINPNVPDVNTDWYDQITRQAPIQNHSLTVRGGSGRARYSIGANYFMQEGILDMKNEYERFNLRTRLDFRATDWLTVGGNVIFSNATQYNQEASSWRNAYYAVPILPVFDDQVSDLVFPTNYASAENLGYRGSQNPFPIMDNSNLRNKNRDFLGNFYAQFNITPDLTFKTSYYHNNRNLDGRQVRLPYFISPAGQRVNSEIIRNTETTSNQFIDNILTYTRDIGVHNITAMAGHSYRDEAFDRLTLKGINFPYENEESWYIEQAEEIIANVDDGDVGDDGRRLYGISYFGRVSYNFDNKYLIYGTYRADGSSKYQEKWGYFPTIGLGWVLTEEDFFNVPGIDYLKLRASWGELGNDKIPASDGAATTENKNLVLDDVLTTGTIANSTFSNLKWEVTEEINVGLTSNMFNQRLSIDADYYIRDTRDAAINVNIPAIGGVVRRNVGEIRNSGFELAASWSDRVNDKLRYRISANIATLKNEVLDLFGQPHLDGGTAEFRRRTIVGESLLAFYGYEVAGVYQNEAEIDADPVAVANGLEPGDFRFVDQNGDGQITQADDRVVLGSYLPDYTYGGDIAIGYKNIDLSISIYGQGGNQILNRNRGQVIFTPDLNMDADLAKNRWHGEGTTNAYPSSKARRKGWNTSTLNSFLIEDGDFFRIQNIRLSYTINRGQMFGAGFPETRINFTADRPLTVFSYNGFNPEVPSGYDNETNPIPGVYTVGLNIKLQ